LAEAGLALLDKTSAGTTSKRKKKALAKAKEAAKEALAKVPGPKSEAKEAEEATKVTKDTMKAGFQASPEDCQGHDDRCCKRDVCVLLKLAFS
jgi:hypothetical protein